MPWRVVFVAWLLFTVFLTYFNMSSNHLPRGAGPDAVHNDDISNFIYEKHRLAVLPDDEAALLFTRYGGTRALRPPLAFVTSAVVASLFEANDTQELRKLFRKGSALLVSIAIVCGFFALWIYFQNLGVAVAGALLMGLMPQISFIASYNNDDSSAILAGTLILLSMVAVYRHGVGWKTLLLFGFSAGITIISKQSGWILFPTVVVFLLLFVVRDLTKAIAPTLAAIAVMLAVGGWWIAFNVTHYGIDDPLLNKVTRETAEKHSRFDPNLVLGYQAQEAGFQELVFRNHDQFMTKTLHSTVGHLDWLRLKVSTGHYGFYLALFVLGLFIWLARLLSLVLPGAPADGRRLLFESVCVLAMLIQFTAYVWINIHNDIQTQGKYLLPVTLAAMIIIFSGIDTIGRLVAGLIRSAGDPSLRFNHATVFACLIAGVGLCAGALHYDSLKSYVLPFYKPAFYAEPLEPIELGSFVPISLQASSIGDQETAVALTKPTRAKRNTEPDLPNSISGLDRVAVTDFASIRPLIPENSRSAILP